MRALDAISSSSFAAVLIAVLIGLVLVGLLVPQAGRLSLADRADWLEDNPLVGRLAQALGLDDLFAQSYFLAVIGLLVVSVAICTALRLARRGGTERTPFLTGDAADRRGLAWRSAPGAREEVAAGVTEALRRTGLVVSVKDGEGCTSVSGVGGRHGFFGSVLFHVALLVVVAGGVLGALTSFAAELVLTEGQVVEIGPSAFLEAGARPRFGGPPTGYAVALDRLGFAYDRGEVVEASATMRVLEGGRETARREVSVNRPLEHRGLSLLLYRPGYSVRLIIRRDDVVEDDAFVTLYQKVAQGYADRHRLPDGTQIDILAVNDVGRPLDGPAERPLVLVDPGAYVRERGRGLPLSGPLRPGESTTVAGRTVELGDVRLYSSFLARKSDGRPVLYAGMWLAVLGVAIRFLDPERWVAVAVREGDGSEVSRVAVLSRGRYGRLGVRRARRSIESALGLDDEGRGRDGVE